MSDGKENSKKSTDPAVQEMISKAKDMDVTTVWDRYDAMTPQCGFGETGLCCRHCLQGPCRINPFGDEPKTGICGASADVMVARGIDRAIAAGTAAHSGHARHLAHAMLKMAEGKTRDYMVKDVEKLKAVAARLGIPVEGRKENDIALDVAKAALADFHEKDTPVLWAATVVTPGRVKVLTDLGLVPKGVIITNSDKCIGCWTCVMVCPYGVIGRHMETRKAYRCDRCPDLQVPACVDACPTKALVYQTVAAFSGDVRQDAAREMISGKGS